MRTQSPKFSGSKYFNYGKYLSINLMAIVDYDYKFLAVNVGAFGADPDGRVGTRHNTKCLRKTKPVCPRQNL